MKKYSLFLLLINLILLFSCGDNVSLDTKDLYKYPWLKPFVHERSLCDFHGTHNIDLGILEFDYKIAEILNEEILINLDSVANIEGWDIIEKNHFSRIYNTELPEEVSVTVRLKIDLLSNRIFFKVQ